MIELYSKGSFFRRGKMFNFGQDIGIDLGTATVLIYVKGKGDLCLVELLET